jgi:hypothetical protein
MVVEVEFGEWTATAMRAIPLFKAYARTSLRVRFGASNHSESMTLADIQALHEPFAYLYVGDYFADTLDLSAPEHRALRLLLLETWVRGPIGNGRLALVTGLARAEWQAVKPAVLPLLRAVQPRIAQSLKNIRAYDGQRLLAADWHIIRSVVLERDRHVCVYCGADKQLEGDHIVPLSLGGSNALTNLATACRPCNLSKASSTLEEWHARRAAVVPVRRGNRQRRIR